MKLTGVLLMILLLSATAALSIYLYCKSPNTTAKQEFYFGVSFGQDTAEEAKHLIDKVKNYTNLFIINNWNINTNETALTQVSEYAAKANLNFMVFFVVLHPWHLTWLDAAKEKWTDKFLGAYLYDEPGGRQIDTGRWFSEAGAEACPAYAEEYVSTLANASNYSDATKLFTSSVSSHYMQYLKQKNFTVFTSDYALYWFDYLAGYDAVLVQLGWDHNTTKHIALCRGAANMQGKDWGAIITWTYHEPPYLADGPEILEDMLAAYHAGAKYIVIFNYAEDSETGKPYSILQEQHFDAMQEFWKYSRENPDQNGKITGQVAYILPKNYGWGMRRSDDNIWGSWPADEKAPQIWENINKLITKYGLNLDIIYEDVTINYKEKYSKVYLWNATIK